MGVIGHVLAALLIYIITGQVYILTTDYLNFSLFFAFAATFPEMQFYLFFVLPIKAKYLALFDGLYFVYGFLFGGMSQRIAIVMSLLNFIVYLFMSRGSRLNPKEIRRKQVFHTQMREAQKTAERLDATAVLYADVRRRTTRILYSATAPSAGLQVVECEAFYFFICVKSRAHGFMRPFRWGLTAKYLYNRIILHKFTICKCYADRKRRLA